MASTVNYGWVKPDVGASDDAWGGQLNADLDGIDSVVHGIDVRGMTPGPPGPQGPAGPTGPKGDTGPAGADGADGVGFPDAPNDAFAYARQGLAWTNSPQFNNMSLGFPFGGSFNPNLTWYLPSGQQAVEQFHYSSSNPDWNYYHSATRAQMSLHTTAAGELPIWTVANPLVNFAFNVPVLLPADPTVPLGAATKQYVDTKAGLYLPLAGGTLTGPLNGTAATFSGNLTAPYGYFTSGYLAVKTASSGDALIDLSKSGSGRNSLISGYTGSTSATALRWQMALGDSAAESGGSAGSNFAIARFGDTGAFIDTPLTINRASGNATFTGSITASGGFSTTNNIGLTVKHSVQPCVYLMDAGGNLKGQYYWQSSSSKCGLWQASGAEAVLNGANQFQTSTFYNMSATAYMAGGTLWTNTSDARIKNIVGEYEPGLDEVLQLRPIRYTFKGNDTWVNDLAAHPLGEDGVELEPVVSKTGSAPYPGSTHYDYAVEQKEFVGFIAQEVEAILPGAVTRRKGFIDGQEVSDMRDLNLHELLFALVNSVKTLAARVEELEAARG